MPGVTQGFFSRQVLVNALKSEISALLTAGASKTIDLDAAAFFSSRRATSAYIPHQANSLKNISEEKQNGFFSGLFT